MFDGPAPPADVVGRGDEIAGLWDRAMHGRFVVLFAPRRYGKTSLIHRLREEAETTEDLAVVLVDLHGIQTLADLAARVGRAYRRLPTGAFGSAVRRMALRSPRVAAQLGIGPVTARIEASVPAEESRPLLDDLLGLPWEAAGATDRRVLVVLDEFQAAARIADAAAVIRASIQHQRDRVSYLFAGSEQSLLDSLFAERAAPLYGQAEQVRLGGLAPEPLGALIDAALTQCRAEFDAAATHLEPGTLKTIRLLAWGEPVLGAAAGRIGLSKGTARGGLVTLRRASQLRSVVPNRALVGEGAAVVDVGEAGDVPGVGGMPGTTLSGVAGERSRTAVGDVGQQERHHPQRQPPARSRAVSTCQSSLVHETRTSTDWWRRRPTGLSPEDDPTRARSLWRRCTCGAPTPLPSSPRPFRRMPSGIAISVSG